jgi:hypothetical protein
VGGEVMNLHIHTKYALNLDGRRCDELQENLINIFWRGGNGRGGGSKMKAKEKLDRP